MSDILISVVICSYNRYDILAESIGSLENQTLDESSFEIFVVDNSPDFARSMTESEIYASIPNLTWFHEPIPGLSHARNIGAQEAKGALIAYLDDDAVAFPNWLECLLRGFEYFGEDAAIVGGQVIPRWLSPRPDWLGDNLLDYLSVLDWGSEPCLLPPEKWLVGTNVAYRRASLLAVGGFNAALGRIGSGISLMSNDETELAERLRSQGGTVGYYPDAAVEHVIDTARLSRSWFRRRIAWQAVSQFVQDPRKASAEREAAWETTRDFLAAQPPSYRTLRGLGRTMKTQGDFQWQLGAIYSTMISLLNGLQADNDD